MSGTQVSPPARAFVAVPRPLQAFLRTEAAGGVPSSLVAGIGGALALHLSGLAPANSNPSPTATLSSTGADE